ncbi:MAG TPA: hypothetical protein VKX45_07035 [Bryobacteraceae bacterium]|nr:hypothetical protein [Bryobacteraceae bacterium]
MRKAMTVCAMLGAFAALGLAETWTGTLVDATCYEKNKDAAACGAKVESTAFLLTSGDKIYKLDEASNQRALQAMKSRADRANNPDATKAEPVNAKITGELKGEHIHAETIEIQQ